MLTCVPKSLCSWDYRVLGAIGPATLTFNYFTEQGSIALNHMVLAVRKHGPLSGYWTLERDGEIFAHARKPSAMFRVFEVTAADLQFIVTAGSPFTRCCDILSGDRVVGSIRPVHAFTRRAIIECSADVPELAQLFSFWLIAITWRRAANNQS